MSRLFVPYTRLSVAAAALLLAFSAAAQTEPAKESPRIFSPEPVFDFGTRDNEEKVQHDFTVMNVGTGTLEISNVKSSCGCTVAELKKKTLAPGEETSISATFDLTGKQGPQTKIISVSSNDPDVPVFKLELKGTAAAAIEVEPRFINLGNVVDEVLAPQTIKVKSNRPEISFNVTGAQVSDPDSFKAEVKTVEAGKSYEIVLSNVKTLEPGISQGTITITTDDPKRAAIPVRYHASVVGDLDIAPNAINLRYTENGEPTQQYMRVAAGRVKEFKLLAVEPPVPDVEVEIIPRGNNNYNIRLANMPTDNTLEGKELIIRTDIASSPEIRIPFKVIKIPNLDGTATLNPTSLRPAEPGALAAPPAAPPAAPAQ